MAKKLPRIIKKIDDLPEDLRPLAADLYVRDEATDSYMLQTDDDDRIKEFRGNNISLKKTLDELRDRLKTYEKVKPEEVDELLNLKQKIEESEEMQLIKAGKVDELINRRTGSMKQQFDKQLSEKDQVLKSLQGSYEKARKSLAGLKIDTAVQAAIGNIASPRPGAMVDILNRARARFDIDTENESVVSSTQDLDPDGKTWTLESWAKHLVAEAPYLFDASTGSGSVGSKSRGRSEPGVTYIDNDPELIGKYAKEIRQGKVKVRG